MTNNCVSINLWSVHLGSGMASVILHFHLLVTTSASNTFPFQRNCLPSLPIEKHHLHCHTIVVVVADVDDVAFDDNVVVSMDGWCKTMSDAIKKFNIFVAFCP